MAAVVLAQRGGCLVDSARVSRTDCQATARRAVGAVDRRPRGVIDATLQAQRPDQPPLQNDPAKTLLTGLADGIFAD